MALIVQSVKGWTTCRKDVVVEDYKEHFGPWIGSQVLLQPSQSSAKKSFLTLKS